jgi:hypothetical protein
MCRGPSPGQGVSDLGRREDGVSPEPTACGSVGRRWGTTTRGMNRWSKAPTDGTWRSEAHARSSTAQQRGQGWPKTCSRHRASHSGRSWAASVCSGAAPGCELRPAAWGDVRLGSASSALAEGMARQAREQGANGTEKSRDGR